jgi:hypothetical protein
MEWCKMTKTFRARRFCVHWSQPNTKLGLAWVALCAAVALHVVDEALTGFLSVYNPTVLALRARLGWWPMPTFEYGAWRNGLLFGLFVLFLLAPLMFVNARIMRSVASVFAVLMIGNGLGHTLATIFGRTVASVRFSRPAPGFWSSPFLLMASGYLLVQLRRTRTIHPTGQAADAPHA